VVDAPKHAAALTINVLTSLARFAVRMAAGEPVATGLLSSSSLSLPDGVLLTMMIKKPLNELIQAERRRLLAQKDYYRMSRIAIDRYIAASSDLARVELLAVKGEAERRAIRRRHVQLAKQVEAHEKAELDAGRSTAPDTTEAHQARLQAEYDMMAGEKEGFFSVTIGTPIRL
jgi:hypothetical protein